MSLEFDGRQDDGSIVAIEESFLACKTGRACALAYEVLERSGVEATGQLEKPPYGAHNLVFLVPAEEQNYYLKISDLNEVGRRHSRSRNALGTLEALHFPAPLLVKCGTFEDLGVSYTLTTEVEGQNLQELLDIAPEKHDAVFYEIGRSLGDLHLFTADRLNQNSLFGEINRQILRRKGLLEQSLQGGFHRERLGRSSAAILSAFETIKEAPRFCMAHGDPKPDNGVFDGEEVTMLDWESARISVPEYDLAVFRILFQSSADAFAALIEGHQENAEDINQERIAACQTAICFDNYWHHCKTGESNQSLKFLERIEEI